jgi:hypothetical protein
MSLQTPYISAPTPPPHSRAPTKREGIFGLFTKARDPPPTKLENKFIIIVKWAANLSCVSRP